MHSTAQWRRGVFRATAALVVVAFAQAEVAWALPGLVNRRPLPHLRADALRQQRTVEQPAGPATSPAPDKTEIASAIPFGGLPVVDVGGAFGELAPQPREDPVPQDLLKEIGRALKQAGLTNDAVLWADAMGGRSAEVRDLAGNPALYLNTNRQDDLSDATKRQAFVRATIEALKPTQQVKRRAAPPKSRRPAAKPASAPPTAPAATEEEKLREQIRAAMAAGETGVHRAEQLLDAFREPGGSVPLESIRRLGFHEVLSGGPMRPDLGIKTGDAILVVHPTQRPFLQVGWTGVFGRNMAGGTFTDEWLLNLYRRPQPMAPSDDIQPGSYIFLIATEKELQAIRDRGTSPARVQLTPAQARTPIDTLGLRARTVGLLTAKEARQLLKRAVRTTQDLYDLDAQLMAHPPQKGLQTLPGIGPSTYDEIRRVLAQHGLPPLPSDTAAQVPAATPGDLDELQRTQLTPAEAFLRTTPWSDRSGRPITVSKINYTDEEDVWISGQTEAEVTLGAKGLDAIGLLEKFRDEQDVHGELVLADDERTLLDQKIADFRQRQQLLFALVGGRDDEILPLAKQINSVGALKWMTTEVSLNELQLGDLLLDISSVTEDPTFPAVLEVVTVEPASGEITLQGRFNVHDPQPFQLDLARVVHPQKKLMRLATAAELDEIRQAGLVQPAPPQLTPAQAQIRIDTLGLPLRAEKAIRGQKIGPAWDLLEDGADLDERELMRDVETVEELYALDVELLKDGRGLGLQRLQGIGPVAYAKIRDKLAEHGLPPLASDTQGQRPATALLGLAPAADRTLDPQVQAELPAERLLAIEGALAALEPAVAHALLAGWTAEAAYAQAMASYAAVTIYDGQPQLYFDQQLQAPPAAAHEGAWLRLHALLLAHEGFQFRLRQTETLSADLTEELALFAEVDRRLWRQLTEPQRQALREFAATLDAQEPDRPDRLGPSLERLARFSDETTIPDTDATWTQLAQEFKDRYPSSFAQDTFDIERFHRLREQLQAWLRTPPTPQQELLQRLQAWQKQDGSPISEIKTREQMIYLWFGPPHDQYRTVIQYDSTGTAIRYVLILEDTTLPETPMEGACRPE